MNEEYFSIKQIIHSQIKVENSKFIADAFPVETEDDAKKFITETRKKYFDATHHCFAFALGVSRSSVRFSDDGEPSGTAGKKILSALEAKKLSDILIVVTRYFGGTKLGVGGLGRAYFESAADCLSHAHIISKAEFCVLKIAFPFEATNAVMNLLHSSKIRIDETSYSESQTILQILVSQRNVPTVQLHILDATRGKCSVEILGKKIVALD